jgi:hypothetical protein
MAAMVSAMQVKGRMKRCENCMGKPVKTVNI